MLLPRQKISRGIAMRKPLQLTMTDLYEACRLHSNQKLATLARKITPKYAWDDIVLPADRLEQLREICNHVKYRERVYGQWGFDRKLSLGKGLSILFAGPSGTGKTMAAEIIAGALGLDLYKIDLSTVVSKYIGETEKNLSRIFIEAETSNSILFFDEADALFGKRSEVKDSHDRYANIEIGYLLQRMEEYEGVVILATNFRKNMDEAFVRRLHFTVEFPFPNEEDRQQDLGRGRGPTMRLAIQAWIWHTWRGDSKLRGEIFAILPWRQLSWQLMTVGWLTCTTCCVPRSVNIRRWGKWFLNRNLG